MITRGGETNRASLSPTNEKEREEKKGVKVPINALGKREKWLPHGSKVKRGKKKKRKSGERTRTLTLAFGWGGGGRRGGVILNHRWIVKATYRPCHGKKGKWKR